MALLRAPAYRGGGSGPERSDVASTDYSFVTRWRVAGTPEEVVAVFRDATDLPRWWPAVYLSATLVDAGGRDGEGGRVDLRTKGWLPYTLRWELGITEPISVEGYTFSGRGDLEGTGRWTFVQDGPETVIRCDWNISAGKPLLRRLSWLFKPVFAANHHWAMARGEESLALELRRRRAVGAAARATVPAPPGPTFRRRGVSLS